MFDAPHKPKRSEALVFDYDDAVIDNDLAAALSFTADDLIANRDGFLTESQRAHLASQRWRSLIVMALPVGILMIFALLAASSSHRQMILGWIAGAAFALLAAVVIGAVWMEVQRINSDIQEGRVRQVTGRIALHIKSGKNTTNCTLSVKSETFTISQETLLAQIVAALPTRPQRGNGVSNQGGQHVAHRSANLPPSEGQAAVSARRRRRWAASASSQLSTVKAAAQR